MESGVQAYPRAASPFAVGLALLGVLLLFFWLIGALSPEALPGFPMSPARTTGMALTYATTPAFLIGALLYADRRTRLNVEQLVDSGCVPREATDARAVGASPSLATNAALTAIGLLFGLGNVDWEAILGALGGPAERIAIGIVVGNVVVWVVVVHVFQRRVVSSNAVRRLGRDHAAIDLLRPDVLLPFGRVGRLDFLIVVVAFSLAAFQSLDAELRFVNYATALAAALPAGALLLALPMLGVRGRLRRAKAERLEALDQALARARRDLEPEALHVVADLLRQREAVAGVREWPLDMTALSRIAIYFVIPPLAWVAGALVELWVEAAL